MRTYKLLKYLSLVLLITASTSCSSPQYKSADDLLQQMNIDQPTFSNMSVCLQIKTYTFVGMHFLDLDHSVAIMPAWIDATIDNQPLKNVADCIAMEGFSRLQILSKYPSSRETVSLAILTLVYKANQLHILENTNVQRLLNASVCTTDLNYSYDIILTYYLARFKKAPSYYLQYDTKKADEQMKAELCNP